MKKFMTNKYSISIKEVDVERETKQSVWINGLRSAKSADWHQYHDTYDNAFDHLQDRVTMKLDAANRNLSKMQDNYREMLLLKRS